MFRKLLSDMSRVGQKSLAIEKPLFEGESICKGFVKGILVIRWKE